jgi:hypothetical protein
MRDRSPTWIMEQARRFELQIPDELAGDTALLAKMAELLELLGEIADANERGHGPADPNVGARHEAPMEPRASVSWYPHGVVELRNGAVPMLAHLIDCAYVRCRAETYDQGARRVRSLVVGGNPLTVVEIEPIVLALDL